MKIYRLYGLNSGEYCQWCRNLWNEDRSKWSWELSDAPRKLIGQDELSRVRSALNPHTFVILKIYEDKDALLFDTTFKGIGTDFEELCSSCYINDKLTVV